MESRNVKVISLIKENIFLWYCPQMISIIKSVFSKKATKLDKTSPLICHLLHNVKKALKIFSTFLAFLEKINFKPYEPGTHWNLLKTARFLTVTMSSQFLFRVCLGGNFYCRMHFLVAIPSTTIKLREPLSEILYQDGG